MHLTQIKAKLKEGKKNSFDRDICPNIDTFSNRCNVCCFWQDLTRIKLLNGKRALEIYGVSKDLKEEDKDKLFVINYGGCAILTEVCPDCIVDVTCEKSSHLIPIRDDRYNQELICKPALLDYITKTKKFYCEICKKKFKHSEVKHLLDTFTIMHIKHPDWFKKKEKKKVKKGK